MSHGEDRKRLPDTKGRAPGAEPERSEGAAEGVRPGEPRLPQRLWAPRKAEAVIRLIAGEDPDKLAREHGVSATDLASWKERFIQGGTEALKRREQDESQELQELRAKVGELTMQVELFRKNRPAPIRSRRRLR